MSEAIEFKLWILGGSVTVLMILIGAMYSIISKAVKYFTKTIIEKIEQLIKEVQSLNKKDALFEQSLSILKTSIDKLEEQHRSCTNFKPSKK